MTLRVSKTRYHKSTRTSALWPTDTEYDHGVVVSAPRNMGTIPTVGKEFYGSLGAIPTMGKEYYRF